MSVHTEPIREFVDRQNVSQAQRLPALEALNALAADLAAAQERAETAERERESWQATAEVLQDKEALADVIAGLTDDLARALEREQATREALTLARDAVLTSCCDTDICRSPEDGCAHGGGGCVRLAALAALASSTQPEGEDAR